MPIYLKKFSGFLNTDDSGYVLPQSQHIMAMNGRFRGSGDNMRFESIPGNTLIANASLPSGENECIGAFEDTQKQRIFYFIWNSNGHNAIFVYNINAQTISIVILCGTNPATDILNFDLNQPIVSINIIYGDSQQGDILYWIDSLKRPTKINIDRALGTITPSYGTYQRSFLDVIKAPASIVPQVAYQDDDAATVNNLNGILFKFKIRFYYNDNDKSVTSSQSVIPLPQGQLDPKLASDPTQNALINIIIPTGESDCYKIEILGSISLGNVFGDFFSIDLLDKSNLSIPSNDSYIYTFRNDRIYAPIDINESDQLFDYVPQEANAQEVLLTNILIYGAITENYNAIVPDIDIVSGGNLGITIPSLSILAIQSGDTGFGTGNIHFSIVGKSAVPASGNLVRTAIVIATSAGNIVYDNTYTSSPPTTTAIISGLTTAATALGFAVVSSDGNNLILSKSNAVLDNFYITNYTAGTNPITQSTPSFDYDDGATYGLVHFDADGRSSGVMTSVNITTTTISYDTATDQPILVLKINNIPPIEAHYYQLVRISNVTKSKLLYWITDRAIPGTDPITNISYVYLSIANLNQYITDNPSTATQLGYSWTANDRLKILENEQSSTVYNSLNDFQIINSLIDPTINGLAYTGQFLQILPPSSGSSIVIDGSPINYNLLIEIYTPSKTISQNANIFNEFGQRFAIGNPGLSNRFYQGEQLNQPSFAQIGISDGGYYTRYRNIYSANLLIYAPVLDEIVISDGGRFFLGETFTESFSVNDYIPQANGGGETGGTYANPYWWLQTITNGFVFLINGQFSFQVLTVPALAEVVFQILEIRPDNTINIFYTQTFSSIVVGQIINIPLAAISYTCSASNSRLYFALDDATSTGTLTLKPLGGSVIFTIPNSTFNVKIIDQNFSDFYPSYVNNNGRAWAIQPNIEQTYTGTLDRYSLAYEIDTNINNVNRFYPQNFDQYDQGRGDIQRFKVRGPNLHVFQETGVGRVPIFQNALVNTSGQTIIGQSLNVINTIQYYEGEYGMGKQYTSLVSGKIQDYFIDPIRGVMLRLSKDGLIPVSVETKGQFYIRGLLTPYNDPTYLRADGAQSRIFGYYDYLEEQYVCILQGGTNATNAIAPNTFSWNEVRNSFCSFYNMYPEFALCAEEVTYSFINGNLYIHNNETQWGNFYGSQTNPSITLVFNDKVAVKKTFLSIAYQGNQFWCSPNNGDIITSQPNQQTEFPQISNLIEKDFEIQEGMYFAAFLNDINSMANQQEALVNGDVLKGNYIQVKLTYRGFNFAFLYLPYINWSSSPKTI